MDNLLIARRLYAHLVVLRLKKAETYSSMMHMSKKGIYDQLTSEYGEKFTQEEADYAIEHLE